MGNGRWEVFAAGEGTSRRAEKTFLMSALGQRRYLVSGEGRTRANLLLVKDCQCRYQSLERSIRADPVGQAATIRDSYLKVFAEGVVELVAGHSVSSCTSTLAQQVSPSPDPTVVYPTYGRIQPSPDDVSRDTERDKTRRITI